MATKQSLLNQQCNFLGYPKLPFEGNTGKPVTTRVSGLFFNGVTKVTFLRHTNLERASKGAGMQYKNTATLGPEKPEDGEAHRRDCLARFVMRQKPESREFLLEQMKPRLRADIRQRMLDQFAAQLMALDPERREARLARIRFNARNGERHRAFADDIEARVRQVQKAEGGDYGRRA